MTLITSSRFALGAVTAAVLLAACGGGDGGAGAGGGGTATVTSPTAPGSDIPLSATTSSAGAVAFVKSVAAAGGDTAEPLTTGAAVLASSDIDEPEPGI